MSTCKRLNWCIDRAMEYAKKSDFKQAQMSFCSDLTKSKCTKVISDHSTFGMIMLFTTVSTVEEFEKLIKGFSHTCICVKEK